MRTLRVAALAVLVATGSAFGVLHASSARAGPPGAESVSAADAQALSDAQRVLDAGGDVNAVLDDDVMLVQAPALAVTRLHVAAERGWLATARFLLDHGANPVAVAWSKSHHNRLRPIDLALLGGHETLLRLLKERALPPVGEERILEIDLGGGEEALPLVSLEEGSWWRVTESDVGSATTADLLIEPGDPQVSGLGGEDAPFRHVLDATAVALVSAGDPVRPGLPTTAVAWKPTLTHREFRIDAPFLVRSSVGAVFGARLERVDARAGRFAIRYALLTPPSAPRTDAGLALAVFQGDAAEVARRLAAGADPTACDEKGRNVLHVAALRGQTEIAALLVRHVAGDAEGGIPSFDRFVASREGLMDAGDAHGLTPLHVAAYEGHAATVRALLNLGADVDATDDRQRTPLHLAALGGHGEVAQALLERNADLHAQDASGRKAREVASTPALAGYLQELERMRPDVGRADVERLLSRFLEALGRGDRDGVFACLAPTTAAELPGRLSPLSFRPRVEFLRIGPREAEVRIVLTLPRETRIGRDVLLTLALAKEGGMGAWQITDLAMASYFGGDVR